MERSCPVPFLPLYLTGKAAYARDLFAVIDEEHYQWALQWKWQAVCSKQGSSRKEKWYATRCTRIFGRGVRVYLHKEILLRSHGMPPSPRYIVGDHMNGDSLDCRASNLRWATPRENRRNYNGMFAMQLRLDFGHTPRYLNKTQERRDGRRTDGQARRAQLSHPAPSAGAPDADCPF